MWRAWVLISNRVPNEGMIRIDQYHCRKWGNTALGKACKFFSRNPAQVNNLKGVTSLTSLWHKSSIPYLLNVESKSLVNECPSLKLNIWYILVRACVRSYSVVHFYKYKRTQLKHCSYDRAKILLHRTQVLTFNTINYVVKKTQNYNLNNESHNCKQNVALRFVLEYEKSYETFVPHVSSWSGNIRKR